MNDFSSCPLCGNQNFRVAFKKNVKGKEYSIVECKDCHLFALFPRPASPQTDLTYNQDYYSAWGKDFSDMKRTTFKRNLKMLEKFGKKGRILDIGCAFGLFLEVAKSSGWQCFGVELSEYSSAIAKKQFGDSIFTGKLEDALYPGEYFDAVVMFDVVEHLDNPLDFIKEISRILLPEGIVMISTPNISGRLLKLMGRNWPHFKEEHLFYYSPSTIRELLNKNHFKILKISENLKAFNASYFISQSQTFDHPGVVKWFSNIMKAVLGGRIFFFPIDEMLVIAGKEGDSFIKETS